MKSSARSYLMEAREKGEPMKIVMEGMDYFVQAFLAIANEANYVDLPIVVAALKTVTQCLEESALYKESQSDRMEKLITALIGHRFGIQEVAIPQTVIDMLEGREEK